MIVFVTWLWGFKYDENDVRKLYAGILRNTRKSFRFILMTECDRGSMPGERRQIPVCDSELLKTPGCFARLRMFDPEWQKALDLGPADKLVQIDLDAVITANIDPVFDRPESFCILQKVNSVNPCPYNASLVMLAPGEHHEVWSEFSIEAARALPYFEFPDDQGWLAQKLPGAPGWAPGDGQGVYAFQKPGWPGGSWGFDLPKDARIVSFIGKRKPARYSSVSWVQQHWSVKGPKQ